MFSDRIEGKWIDAFCEVFEKCGRWDEEYHFGVEDIDDAEDERSSRLLVAGLEKLLDDKGIAH